VTRGGHCREGLILSSKGPGNIQRGPPIDITARFGEDADVAEVDSYVRHVMQKALDRLASQRRFPVLG
jgi:hypothetical protein